MATTFNDTQMTEFKRLVARYPEGKQKSALLPALHLAQDSFGGWLSTETMDYVASLLNIEPIEVYEVATFYSMYNLKPVGKFVFEFCQTGPCNIQGVKDVIAYTSKTLGIKEGEVTADGLFSNAVGQKKSYQVLLSRAHATGSCSPNAGGSRFMDASPAEGIIWTRRLY
jgi:NADH-quinone oxidoreductase subunit E